METADSLVFWAVVLGRLLIPLIIPRYPLPGVVAALLLDAVDQTIFQVFTNLNLDGYQGYDKALDIYYLTITYISTLRNWTNLFAFKVSRFLWYYRLVGVTLFELLHLRPLLLIFPNTFEYFFIFYEFVSLRWNPRRLTRRATIIATAAIWIFIKLPQEWWIHIAQLDTTDFVKETVFGVPVDTAWSTILTANLWVIPVLALVTGALALLLRWILRRLPPAEWALSFSADAHREDEVPLEATDKPWWQTKRFFNNVLLEKTVLVALVSIIFAQIMPDMRATNLQLAVGVVFIIFLNTVISHWLSRRGTTWRSVLVEFGAMAVVNFGLALLYIFLLPRFDGELNLTNTFFFVLLLTLIVTLFDRYYPVFQQRAALEG
ncbi:MAG: hypothetical protein PVH65_02140 [Chloroflexota bacterium]|jgi:hypothetical protein